MEIRETDFDGLRSLEITTSKLRLIAVTDLGPRIAFLGRRTGGNLLYWKVDEIGREGWRLLGGHRVWATRPLADESEDAYAADNDPCEVIQNDNSVTIIGAPHPFLKTRRGVTLEPLDEQTFKVTSFITNTGPMLYSGGVWCPTCLDPSGGKEFGILLGDRRLSWDVINIVIPRTFAGHTSRVNDPQIRFTEEFMLIEPQGVETKRMVMAPLGIIAMTWSAEKISFIKRTQSNPYGNYPHGCNLAFYVAPNNFMVEMESYGEESTLRPGETLVNVETWKLVDEVLNWEEPARLIQLMGA